MKTRLFTVSTLLAIIAWLAPGVTPLSTAQSQLASFTASSPGSDSAHVSAALRNSPVMFIENAGQLSRGARFQVRGGNSTIWLADDAIWVTVSGKSDAEAQTRRDKEILSMSPLPVLESQKGVNLKFSFVGANPKPRLESFNRLDTHISYFIGNDPARWRTDVPVWGGVRYKDLYPGIDLEITSENGQMIQRVVAHAGANPNVVQLRVDGVDKMTLDSDRLRLTTVIGELTVPLLQVTGTTSTKPSRPTIAGNQVTAPFTSTTPQSIIVNPKSGASDLLYATFLGSTDQDYGRCIVTDSSGTIYVTGETWSSDFPTTPGGFDPSFNGSTDAFVIKLNATGSTLIYATFLGGSGSDGGYGIAIDPGGAAYITGWTSSSDFPATPEAFDPSYNGGDDIFVVKLNAAGSALTYATFLGGSGSDYGYGIATDSNNTAYVTGRTGSSDFPTTPEAFDSSYNGSNDAFVVKLNAAGSALTYATFLGGSGSDGGYGIAIDSSGAAYVVGWTESSDFPTTPGGFDPSFNGSTDAFVIKLNATGSTLIYATFLGGSNFDWGWDIAIDLSGAAYITGWTSSSDFPATPEAFDPSYNGGDDVFVVKLNAAGSALTYATFLGGSGNEGETSIAVDLSGAAYVTGTTNSSNFPNTPGVFDPSFNGSTDAFAVKLWMGNNQSSLYIYLPFIKK